MLTNQQSVKHHFAIWLGVLGLLTAASAATNQRRYYAHDAVLDKHGVIAPWYRGLNGQCDYRIRIAAETLKRYPWTTTNNAIAAYPDYLFTSKWQISSNGVITPQDPGDWMNGDLGQRSTSVLNAMVDYYRYSGDPAAIAHMTYMGDLLLDHALTPADHPWPKFPISVPTKGKAYFDADPNGMIQLDICGDMGRGLLRAYQVTGNKRWFDAAKHWGDLFAEKCNFDPNSAPWPRYANPETVKWPGVNEQTGGVTMILAFLDELIRLGHTGENQKIIKARDAGLRYLNEKLLPEWTVDKTWGLYFWDWPNPVQNCSTTADVVSYIIANQKHFPNWRNDARNILTTFLNRSSVNPASGGDVYSGAWAYPESSSCCGRSLWYAPLMDGAIFAQYGLAANDDWARELAYRQMILQTYDIHENGVSEDNIDGGVIVNGNWLNIAHPWPLRWVSLAIGWMPEELGASRENHFVRSSSVVNSIVYGDGEISYTTFDAPENSVDVFRLSFVPKKITADGKELSRRRDVKQNGFTVKKLSNGDAIVEIRRDGFKEIVIAGNDPQTVLAAPDLSYEGAWKQKDELRDNSSPSLPSDGGEGWGEEVQSRQLKDPSLQSSPHSFLAGRGSKLSQQSRSRTFFTSEKGASVIAKFYGNQFRLVGRADEFGGQAEVYIDDEKQIVPIDFWNPSTRKKQILYYKNGLENREHTLKIVALGTRNPYSQSDRVYVSSVQFSSENEPHSFPTGTGPTETQRMIFGFPKREDYRDTGGDFWRPAVEVVTRFGQRKDSVETGWWTNAAETITGTRDPELYRYGYHAPEFWANLTVGPGKYDVRLAFANTRHLDTHQNCFDIFINGKKVVEKLDVTATAGGPNKAVDLIFKNIAPSNGVVEVRFKGLLFDDGDSTRRGEAFVQALEIGKNLRGKSARPISSSVKPASNILLNPGFEETALGLKGAPKKQDSRASWTTVFGGKTNSYVFQESEYRIHPKWGLPEFHSGEGAIRTHSDGDSRTTIYQDVEVKPNTSYRAVVWVRAVDLRGKGFGKNGDESAGLVLQELTSFGKVLRAHPKIEVKQAGPYTKLSQAITTGAETMKVRFALETILKCHYTEGHVTYDDCVFQETQSDSSSR